MDIEECFVRVQTTCDSKCHRSKKVESPFHKPDSFVQVGVPTEDEIVAEARRCIYCADAPCTSCCPTNIDVKEFIHAASARNWYYAAKVILSSNPLPLSTGNICNTDNMCAGGCNLKKTKEGSIDIGAIQVHSVRRFRDYKLKQILPPSVGKKVAVVGAGPSGLSCAAFLRRIGVDVTVFEAESYAGGLIMRELLPFRVPTEDTEFEVQMIKDSGVEFKFNKTLGKDFTVDSLLKEGYNAVYLAFGKPDKIKVPFKSEGAITAREFLTDLNGILKFKNGKKLPDYTGKNVCVLGCGGTACDVCSAARILGGDVTMACFEDFRSMPAPHSEIRKIIKEGVDIMTLVQVQSIQNGEVKFTTVEHCKDGSYKPLNEIITRKYDVVIQAFGAALNDSKSLIPGQIKVHKVEGYENVFAGGDITGVTQAVEAVNDGKYAASQICKYLGIKGDFPMFETVVDRVSIETDFCGKRFINPIGISSGEVSGTYECCRNALLAGMGFCTTKTILLNKDIQRDNDMRIVKCDDNPFSQRSFMNIAMLSEHNCDYWLDAIRKLKAEFKDRIIIASISAMDNKEDWLEVTKLVCEAGADFLELNLSCPNEVHGEGGHAGGYHSSNKIGMALGTHPLSIKRICEYVSEAATVPFFVKLTPNITDPVEIATASLENGSTGLSMINTVSGIPKFYLDGTPLPQVGPSKLVLSGGLSGDQIRPIALRQIAKVHLEHEKAPIIAMGGIWNFDTLVQHLYAGGNIFSICSATIRYSYEVVREMMAGLRFVLYSWSRPDLRSLLSSHSMETRLLPHKVPYADVCKQDRAVPTLLDLRGLGAKKVVQRESLPPTWTISAWIDPDICVNCGKCALTCRDNGNNAIFKDENGSWKVSSEKCVGCGACVSVCPLLCLHMVHQKEEKVWHWVK